MNQRIALLGLLLALPVVAAEAPPPVQYDGGFRLVPSEDFSLKVNGRVQARYTWEVEDPGGAAENAQHFSIPRARLKLGGNAFSKAWKYTFQTDFGKGGAALKDFYITWVAVKGALQVDVGQQKRAYSRHQLASSGDLELVDRSLTDEALPTGRDIGVAIGSGRSVETFEWSLGVFNGTGDKAHFVPKTDDTGAVTDGKFSKVPGDFLPVVVARAGYNHGFGKDDKYGYREADFTGGGLRFAVAANALGNLNATNDEDPAWVVGGDYALKVAHFSSVGEFHRDLTKDAEANLFFVQAGYAVAGRYQPAVRYAMVKAADGDAQETEIAFGVSAYFFKHNAKLQADYALLGQTDAAGAETDDSRLRLQLQFAF